MAKLKAVTVTVFHVGEDYATIQFHKNTSQGGKTLMFDVPLEVAEWINPEATDE